MKKEEGAKGLEHIWRKQGPRVSCLNWEMLIRLKGWGSLPEGNDG